MTAITITATLTEEQALILAKEKGYSETVTTCEDMTVPFPVFVTNPNAENPFEFLKRVYEAVIIADAQKHYIEYDKRLSAEARRLADEAIKADVVAAVSSSLV